MLKKAKARLQQEIKFATERAQQSKSLLANKLQRRVPVFKSIDAGKPASATPIAPAQVQRKYARIGTAEEMNFGGNMMMVMVNDRAISQASYDGVMNYLRESGNKDTDALRAQRVLFDLIRIEAIASNFIENEGEIHLSENLAPLEAGEKTFADVAAKFGTVDGAKKTGEIDISRNSILGPYFEYVAFSTPVGKISRPFRTVNGYALIKVKAIEKGANTALDKVNAQVVQFAYSANPKVMQSAQFKVNSGQIDLRVLDQKVLDLLPALFKPAPARVTPMQQLQQQIAAVRSQLKDLGDADASKKQALEGQLMKLNARVAQLNQAASDAPQDLRDSDSVQSAPLNKARKKSAPLNKAPVKSAPLNKARKKSAPLNKAPEKSATLNKARKKSAPLKKK
jgi:hypothetical protein